MRSFSSPAQRRLLPLVGATLLTLMAATVYGVVTTQNVEVATRAGYAADMTDEGGIVEYIGDQNTSFGSSGSGIFDSFVRVQADDNESGYNTDGDLEFDTKGGNFTHSMLVSEIPIVPCSSLSGVVTSPGELCWELFADLNESDSTKHISLDDFEIYFTSDPEITDYPTGWGTPVYSSDDHVEINDVNQGSGRGDLRYLVPLTEISLPANCDYGNAACATYFVLYSAYGDTEDFDGTPGTSTYDSDGGFEEWKVKRYPFLDVSKTATTTFTRTFPWTIDKSVTPASWALFDGDSGTSDYTVALTKGAGADSNWAVSGTITIDNPSDQDAPIASVTDVISGVGSVTVNCGVTFPYTLPDGDTLNCTYSSSLPNGDTRTNTATATLTSGPVFTGNAAVTFGSPTTLVNDTVHVDDTYSGGPQDMAFSASGQTTYSRTFECADDEGTINNTATITETSQSDSASVTVTCYDLTVTKTAVESFARDFDWTIEKSVDPTSLDLFDGDSEDVTWTVSWTKSAAQDSGYAVNGSITVANNHPSRGAVVNSLSDVITTGLTAAVDCGVGVTFPHTIAAGGSLVCSYSRSLPDSTTRTNTATATQQNYDYASDLTATADGTTQYSGTASVDFTGVTPTVTDDTATLSDARPGNTIDGDSVSASGSTSWDETFTCGEDAGSHTNTARVTEDDSADFDQDDATTTVNCYGLTVQKNATTTFTRDYNWDISKTRVIAQGETDGDNNAATLELQPNQVYTATYQVVVGLDASTPYVDSNWAVSGTITIQNPAPIQAMGVSVSDLITKSGAADIAATVDCDAGTAGNQTTVNVPAKSGATNGSATCSYSASLPDGTARTNTATATLFSQPYTGSANVTFGSPTTLVDECVNVSDDHGGSLGQVCVGSAPVTFTYTLEIGPYAACGVYEFPNTATYLAVDDSNDTGETDSSTYTVTITVPCPEGCTLTQGYWKTHNDSFHGGAPTDETWSELMYWAQVSGTWTLLGPGDETSPFFLSGQSYFQVMWTAPKGNAYYNLATQYIAAQLNMLAGADPTAAQTAFDAATVLFKQYTPADIAALKGKAGNALRAQFISLAGTLGSYNEGLIGPGHCDEDGTSSAVVLPPLLPIRRRRMTA